MHPVVVSTIGLFGTKSSVDSMSSVQHGIWVVGALFHLTPDVALVILQVFFGTVFGTWAIVQGARAVKRNRGRSHGIAAIVIAIAAPLVRLVVWLAFADAIARVS